MEISYSKHWHREHARKRRDITHDMIEFALHNSREMRDEYWKDAFNTISRIPPSGRILKVVYKKSNTKIFIITAYWLD